MHTWYYHVKYHLPLALMLLASVVLAFGFVWFIRLAWKAKSVPVIAAWMFIAFVCAIAATILFYVFGVHVGLFRI